MNEQIDIVVTWVDSNDTEWAKDFARYKYGNSNPQSDTGNERYRDWGLLKYWFRGIEKFAPWVRYVHFVTCGHVPAWLNTSNPKLRVVRHRDYVPSEFLPLFNSNPIELMMHRIPDLAEHFIYFNDDFYLTKPVLPDYFFCGGKPCEMAVAKNHHSMDGVMLGIIQQDMNILKSEFNVMASIFKHPILWFNPKYRGFLKLTLKTLMSGRVVSLLDTHAPAPYLKSTFNEVWEKYEKPLTETMTHRFRTSLDVSHWLFRYWQIVKGVIEPRNLFASTEIFYQVGNNIDDVVRCIEEQKCSVLVLNDSCNIKDVDAVIDRINVAFEGILPEKSSFEK